MPTIVVRLDPNLLENPDADIRYRLPEILAERSGGIITDDGYDYVGGGPLLVPFLKATKLKPGLECVLEVIQNTRVLNNDLSRSAVVAVERTGGHRVVYPPSFTGPFLPE